MPKTNAEQDTDITNIQTWQAMQNMRNVKIDVILDTLTEQGKSFETAMKLFQESVNDNKLVTTRIQDKLDFTWKVFGVVGSVILLIAGTVIGQFVHVFHP